MATNMNMVIYNLDNISQDGLEIDSSGAISQSHPIQVADGIKNTTAKYASLDESWVLDGSYHLAPRFPSHGQMGWWGNLLAGLGGIFTTPQFIKINIIGSDLSKINATFDNKRMEYAVDFDINIYYNGSLMGDSPYEIRGNTEVEFEQVISNINLYDEYEIIIYKWSHEGRQAKVLELVEADIKYFDFDDVITMDFLEEAVFLGKDLVSGNVSSNELVVQFYNTDDKFSFYNPNSEISGILKDNRLVEVVLDKDGTTIPIGKFWTTEWDVSESEYTVKMMANDIIRRMDESLYKNVFTLNNTNAGVMIQNILVDFGIDSYNIDSVFYNYDIEKGFLPLLTHRQALEYVLSAFGGYAFVDRNGSLIVKQVADLISDEQSTIEINTDLAFSKDIQNKRDVFDTFEVNQYSLNSVGIGNVLRENGVGIVGGTPLELDILFSRLPVDNVSVSLENNSIGATVSNLEVFSWGISLVINSSSSGNVDIVVDGNMYDEVKIPITGGKIGSRKYKLPDNSLRQVKTVISSLITSFSEVYGFQAVYLDATYLIKDVPDINLMDNMDSFTLKDNPLTARKFKLLRQELSYDGAITTKIKGRAIQ